MKKILNYIVVLSIVLIIISCTNDSKDKHDSFVYPTTLKIEKLYEIDNGYRNGEGAFILLRDNRLAYIYTCFNNGVNDNSSSDICIIKSKDEDKKKWSTPEILINNHGIENIMSVSLLRLPDNSILIQYLEKNSCNDLKIVRRYSFNELETVSQPYYLDTHEGYNVVNNDRVLLYNNHIYTPISRHLCKDGNFTYAGIMELSITDTDIKGYSEIINIDTNDSSAIFQEPGIINLNRKGRMLMWFRNSTNNMFISKSDNYGKSFSQPIQIGIKTVPYSPSSIKRYKEDLFLVYNKWDKNNKNNKRTPLILSISKTELASLDYEYILEDDNNSEYMYTSMYKLNKDLFLAYMVQKGRKITNRIVKIKNMFGVSYVKKSEK